MAFSQETKQALKQVYHWLLGIRRGGSWQDMVYKRPGIINTCEAWRSMGLLRQVFPQLRWPEEWVVQDCEQLLGEVQTQGFVRTPYCPTHPPHASIDAAAFVLLMIHTLYGNDRSNTPKAVWLLAQHARDWLQSNQAPEGGWSWGTWQSSSPLYPYFTYMAQQALREEQQGSTPPGEAALLEMVLGNGAFPAHSLSNEPDIAATAYAAIALSNSRPQPTKETRQALAKAVRFLLSLSLTEITQVGHLKIVQPDQPPQWGVSYENYAVAADVLLALVKARALLEHQPSLDDRIQFLVHHLLEHQEPRQGWPRTYSTLYVTHTVIEALVTYLQSFPAKESSTGSHFNPYIFGFPIQQKTLFFGREPILQRIQQDIRTSPSTKRDIALIGERRIGKTSLLYQLRHRLPQDGHRTFYLDLELVQSIPQLLQTFIAELGQAVFGTSGRGSMARLFSRAYHRLDRKLLRQLELELQTPFFSVSSSRIPDMFRVFLADVEQLLERFSKWRPSPETRIVCLLDEIGSLAHFEEERLYSLLRGLAQGTPDLVLVVAGTPNLRPMLTDVSSPFYNIFNPIQVGCLDQESAMELITQPVQGRIRYRKDAIEWLLQASQRHPYTLQALCYHCIRLLPASEQVVDRTHVQQAIQERQQSNWEGE